MLLLGLGGKPHGSIERRNYDGLRLSLEDGGWPARVYSDRLTRLLDGVDRFFGDIDSAGQPRWARSAFPRAFGLKTPAAPWTAAAYDRCLLLALIYPPASIFAMWTISGHVGATEAALGLHEQAPDAARAVAFCSVSGAFIAYLLYIRTSGFLAGSNGCGWPSRWV
jgi:hypothetical protein